MPAEEGIHCRHSRPLTMSTARIARGWGGKEEPTVNTRRDEKELRQEKVKEGGREQRRLPCFLSFVADDGKAHGKRKTKKQNGE